MKALVAKAMREGAFGLSTGLYYAPGSFARTDEVVALARVAAARGGLYDSHTRDESSYTIGLLGSIQEALDVGREAGIPVNISHIGASWMCARRRRSSPHPEGVGAACASLRTSP
jgi:N-acyl-D-aspartate/D-glutamate deacylase